MELNNNPELEKTLNDSASELNSHVQEQIEKKAKRGPKGPRKEKQKLSLESQAVAVKLTKDQYAQALSGVFVVSGMFLTKFSGFDGFAMSEEEVQTLSIQGAEVCDLCMPSVDPKTLAIGGFTLSIAGIYGMKYLAFKEHMQAKQKAAMIRSATETPSAPEIKPAKSKDK